MPPQTPPGDTFLFYLGQTIKERRLRRGLTQPELASLIDSTLYAVRSYEQGLRGPSVEKLWRIARACDLPLSLFVAPLDGLGRDDGQKDA